MTEQLDFGFPERIHLYKRLAEFDRRRAELLPLKRETSALVHEHVEMLRYPDLSREQVERLFSSGRRVMQYDDRLRAMLDRLDRREAVLEASIQFDAIGGKP